MGVQLDSRPGGKKGITPNINVTPLVDVVLVLLIIFMVIIPNMQDGKAIEMIKVAQADKPDTRFEPIVITIDRDEVYSLDDADVPRARLISELRQLYAENPKRPVLLRGDSTLHYEVMRGLFKDVQEIGFGGIALAVGVAREWTEGGS